MRVVAIIPARGGSKGTPRKNLEKIGGVPLVARSVAAALGSRFVDQVIVSTDDDEIGQIANQAGAQVVLRPADLARDESMSEEAILHVLDVIERPDLIVFLQCTSPFTTSKEIDEAMMVFLVQHADSLVSVVPTHGFLWKKNGDGNAVPVNHDKSVRPRRQDLESQYLENGAIYIMETHGFQHAQHRFFGRTAMYVMDPSKWLEIDSPYDMFLAHILVNHVK